MKKVTLDLKLISNNEYGTNPDVVRVVVPLYVFNKAKRTLLFLNENGVNKAEIWYAASYEFFNEDEDEGLIPFSETYQVDGAHLQVFGGWGFVNFSFPFKFSNDESWTEDFPFDDLEKLFADEEKTIDEVEA